MVSARAPTPSQQLPAAQGGERGGRRAAGGGRSCANSSPQREKTGVPDVPTIQRASADRLAGLRLAGPANAVRGPCGDLCCRAQQNEKCLLSEVMPTPLTPRYIRTPDCWGRKALLCQAASQALSKRSLLAAKRAFEVPFL